MSELLKLSLALEDRQIKRRVFAALVMRVNTMKHRTDPQGMFARIVLAEPDSARWDDFVFPVVSDSEVLAAIAMAPDNSQVYATNVTDEQIINIVNREVNQTHTNYLPQPADPETGE